MNAKGAIASLDRMIGQYGQDVVLQIGGTPSSRVTVEAFVRFYQPQELVGSVLQGDSLVMLSPSELERVNWNGLPMKDDKIVVSEKTRNVQAVNPFYIGNQLVRVEIQVRG